MSIQELLAQANCQPLWDRYRSLVSKEPITIDSAMRWSWAGMQPLIEQAVLATSQDDAERRVLLLTHPAFEGKAATTTNILAGLQILQPGEHAPPHRHTLGALRFVLEGSGAETSVDDTRCPMQKGDLILTPSWRWHEHINHGTQRLVWFDCLDLPLVHHLSSVFFQPGPASEKALDDAAMPKLLPLQQQAFYFPWAKAQEAVSMAPEVEAGYRYFRYPQTQMPSLDCGLYCLASGTKTKAMRTTSNSVIVVAKGQGISRVGETKIEWQENDVFSLPHWQWIEHEAFSDAIFFQVTDEPLLRMLGYLRAETRPNSSVG
jgi:gentisate 1,2-dioxygenase